MRDKGDGSSGEGPERECVVSAWEFTERKSSWWEESSSAVAKFERGSKSTPEFKGQEWKSVNLIVQGVARHRTVSWDRDVPVSLLGFSQLI